MRIKGVFTLLIFLWIQIYFGIIHTLMQKEVCFAKDIATIEKEYNKVAKKIKQFDKDHPLFMITGKIKNREDKSIQVWGLAIPRDNNQNIFGAVWNDSNIIIENPSQNGILIDHYQGEHNFFRKQYGKNIFGSPVPVWVYGDEPERLKLQNLLSKLKGKIEKYRQAELEQGKGKEVRLTVERKRLEQEKIKIGNSIEEIKQEIVKCKESSELARLHLKDSLRIVQEMLKTTQESPGQTESQLTESLKKFQKLLAQEKLEFEKNWEEFEQAEVKMKQSREKLEQANSREELENAEPRLKELLEKMKQYRKGFETKIKNLKEGKEFFMKCR